MEDTTTVRNDKRNIPFTLAGDMGLFSGDGEPNFIKPFSYFKSDSRLDLPEFTKQMTLEIIHDISHSALKIYIDGSMSDGGISESSMQDILDIFNGLIFIPYWIEW
ncbi:hypothetical protein TNCV_3560881 [Trichonephila clavipes]|nr:hypothetical protein TNCV_3560881 [Trichonephila clavipes]